MSQAKDIIIHVPYPIICTTVDRRPFADFTLMLGIKFDNKISSGK